MILTQEVTVKMVRDSQASHYRERGYNAFVPNEVTVKVADLNPNSCHLVECRCVDCNSTFTRQYYKVRNKPTRCKPCVDIHRGKTRNFDYVNRNGKYYFGDQHHNWNPNKSEYKKYKSRVMYYTRKAYKENKQELNPNNHKLTVAGTLNGYQIDHIIPIKYGFENNLPPETIGDINNLRIVTWKENRDKWFHYSETTN